MYLSDLVTINNNSEVIDINGGLVTGKLFFESNPEILDNTVNLPNNIVTKKYLDQILSNLFGPNIFDENKLISPVNFYVFNFADAECYADEYLIFQLVTAPIPKSNITLKLNIISGSAISGIDFINTYEYSEDGEIYYPSQDNNLIINSGIENIKIRIKTETNSQVYGEKILIVKITEIVNYNSPENPYFIYNDIGVGKIKERLSMPKHYNLLVNNPICNKNQYLVFSVYLDDNVKITDYSKKLEFKFEILGLTAIPDIDYFSTNLEYSYNLTTWLAVPPSFYLSINDKPIYVRVQTKNRQLYTGDKTLLFRIVSIITKPEENAIVAYLNSGVGMINEIYPENVNSSLVISNSYCNEGEDLIFDTEILNYNFNIADPAAQVNIYYDINNLTAYSGIDFNEVMYYSLDDGLTYIQSSTRIVVYNTNKAKIKIPTVYRDDYNNDRTLLLKPLEIISKPNNLILNISDIGIGIIKDIDLKPEYIRISINDNNIVEGNNIVFDLNFDNRSSEDTILEIDLKDLTAVDSVDYLKSSLQYSINEGSTYIDASFNSVIVPKNYLNIKLRLNTIRNANYTNTRSFFIKVKNVIQKKKNIIFDCSDIGIGNILDDKNPPVNYKITLDLVNSTNSIKQGGDLLIKGYIYPPLQEERLEFTISTYATEDDNMAEQNVDYSLLFSSFKTNTVNIYNSITNTNTISLIKNTSEFTIKIPTYLNLNKNYDRIFNLKINTISLLPTNSNVDITDNVDILCTILK